MRVWRPFFWTTTRNPSLPDGGGSHTKRETHKRILFPRRLPSFFAKYGDFWRLFFYLARDKERSWAHRKGEIWSKCQELLFCDFFISSVWRSSPQNSSPNFFCIAFSFFLHILYVKWIVVHFVFFILLCNRDKVGVCCFSGRGGGTWAWARLQNLKALLPCYVNGPLAPKGITTLRT